MGGRQTRYLNNKSDADGRFVMRFLHMPNRQMQARARSRQKQSEPFTVEVLDEPIQLIVR